MSEINKGDQFRSQLSPETTCVITAVGENNVLACINGGATETTFGKEWFLELWSPVPKTEPEKPILEEPYDADRCRYGFRLYANGRAVYTKSEGAEANEIGECHTLTALRFAASLHRKNEEQAVLLEKQEAELKAFREVARFAKEWNGSDSSYFGASICKKLAAVEPQGGK